jgi:hypothetical protein
MIIVITEVHGLEIVVKESKSEYCNFIKDYTLACYELYIDSAHMNNFSNLDDLNEYVNEYLGGV